MNELELKINEILNQCDWTHFIDPTKKYNEIKAKLLQMFTAGATSPMQSSFQDLGEGKGNKVNTDQLTEARIDELTNHVAECLVINNETFDWVKDRIKALKEIKP
ncbi:MAG TPA: hypothetical protein VII94_00265 [Candidatus Saccharimonadales bacterium]